MKRKILLSLLVLVSTISIASAQNTKVPKAEQKHKTCHVDANLNGICDNHESGSCTTCTCNGTHCNDGKGLHNGTGRKNGKGHNAGKGLRDGSGRENGGRGANHVDANGNGVCDHKEDKK